MCKGSLWKSGDSPTVGNILKIRNVKTCQMGHDQSPSFPCDCPLMPFPATSSPPQFPFTSSLLTTPASLPQLTQHECSCFKAFALRVLSSWDAQTPTWFPPLLFQSSPHWGRLVWPLIQNSTTSSVCPVAPTSVHSPCSIFLHSTHHLTHDTFTHLFVYELFPTTSLPLDCEFHEGKSFVFWFTVVFPEPTTVPSTSEAQYTLPNKWISDYEVFTLQCFPRGAPTGR